MSQIDKLTPEQEALIPAYREKWRKIARSTESIDQAKAMETIEAVYKLLGKQQPEIVLFASPYAALESVMSFFGANLWSKELGKPLANKLNRRILFDIEIKLCDQIRAQTFDQFEVPLMMHLRRKFGFTFTDNSFLYSTLAGQHTSYLIRKLAQPGTRKSSLFYSKFRNVLPSENWAWNRGLYDFCISALGCRYDLVKWNLYQAVADNLYWCFPYENVCFTCDRPRLLRFDSENRLHAEGKPAIQFADGYSLYSHHGVALPEKYGKAHPYQWQSEWLLTESNAELRRVLIQGIGYARICQELQAVELDAWREYALLKISADADVEPIYLLKMTCPSTGHIHALRVPPAMTTAREAIRWVNWDADPEAFAVQT
ncbi:MAG: DUF6745 domain-containing protein [Stenomitos frigidus ULC029]